MHHAAEHRTGVVLVTSAAVAWSTAGFFTRLIPLDAWTILFWRGLFGGFFIGLYVLWRYRARTLAVTRAMGWPGLLVTCLSTIGMTTFIPALKLTSVANVAIVFAACPFVAAAFAWIWFRERATPLTLGASLLAFAGVVLTVAGGDGGRELAAGRSPGPGDDPVAIAAMTVAMRRYRHIPLLPTACLSNWLGALVGLGFAAPLVAGPQDLALSRPLRPRPDGPGSHLLHHRIAPHPRRRDRPHQRPGDAFGAALGLARLRRGGRALAP